MRVRELRKTGIGGRHVFFLILIFSFLFGMSTAASGDDRNDYRNAQRSGTQWRVYEQGWTGVWIRRANSNTFDATWTMPGQAQIQGVVDMRWDGRNIRMSRTDTYTNQHCEYQGQVSQDGRTASGWLSCNNGPRVDWNAEIYTDTSTYPANRQGVPPPAGVPWGQSRGIISPNYNQTQTSWQYDLTGIWRCNDGGTYYVRQINGNVWWYGESPNGQWSNIFHGAMNGNLVEGFWLDVPKGRDRNNGAMRLQVDSNGQFHQVNRTGDDFGGSRWDRVQ